jgi:membrane-associated protease RseP (regulator of RpoE activity)
MRLDDIGGGISAETGGGTIEIGTVNGDIGAHTGGGGIQIRHANGKIIAETGGGSVEIGAGSQGASIETGGGSVEVRQCNGRVKVSTGGGSVDLSDVGGPADIETGGGSIRLASAKGHVHAETGGGGIELYGVPSATAETSAGGIVVKLLNTGGERHDSDLETGAGDITVYIASDVAVNVWASLDLANGHRITSEFPDIHVSSEGGQWGPKTTNCELRRTCSGGTTMRKYFLTSLMMLPMLLGSSSFAVQEWSVDPPAQPWAVSSDEGGTSSYLGVDITDVTTERLSALKLKEEKGVEVTMVDQDAPAGKAGIKEHDVILSMNGAPVESGAQLRRMIHETPAGRTVTLGLSRDGAPLSVKVQLADKHKEFAMIAPKAKDFKWEMPEVHVMPDIDIPSINMVVVTSSARSGLTMENITPQLGEFFGVKNGNGVLIRSVEKGSRAEKAGFKAGDVIIKVNDEPVHDTSDFSHAMKSRSGNSVNVGVVRDKKEQNLNLALPDRKESGLLEEESWEDQDLDADSVIEIGNLQDQVAKLQPQIELAKQYLNQATENDSKTLCEQQRKLREESQKMKTEYKQAEKQYKHAQEQFKVQLWRTPADI